MEWPFQLSVTEVFGLREQGTPLLLLDVREPDEVATARIEGSRHLPLGEVAARFATVLPDKNQRMVVYCHHGMRSARAAEFLQKQGYTQVQNMAGGIDAWSGQVDPDVPRY